MSESQEIIKSHYQNRKYFIDSGAACKDFLEHILVKTYQGVGLQNAKKMAPKNTNVQTLYTLKSFINVAFTQQYKTAKNLRDQKDPIPSPIDNIAVQQIELQKSKSHQLTSIIQQTHSIHSTKSRLKTKKTQKSVRSRKFTQIDQNIQQTKLKQLQIFEKLPQIKNQYDFSNDFELNKIRNNYLNIQRENSQRQLQLKRLKQKGQIQRQRSQKMVKQMKKITYDYQGKLFNQGNGISQPQKLISLSNKYGNIKKNLLKTHTTLQKTLIQTTNKKKDNKTDRKDFKDVPMFREQGQSIIQTIQNDGKGLAAGVKIIQQLGKNQHVTKQNPLKKPTLHSLAQFKSSNKQSRFKQYHPISLNKDKSSYLNLSSSLNQQQTFRSKPDILRQKQKQKQKDNISYQGSNKIGGFKSRSSYSLWDQNKSRTLELLQDIQSSNRQQVSILDLSVNKINIPRQKVQYRGLPFIKTKGYKAIDFSSQKSFKILSNQESSRNSNKIRSKINKIIINDIQLFKKTLEDA